MAAAKEPPLDEIQWRSPEAVQEMGGSIHTNTGNISLQSAFLPTDSVVVLHYFARSPFFDMTSNNATLINQAMHNQTLFYLVQTRTAFEERLKSMQGLEFMVTHDPSEGDTKHDHSGVWVIRKQIRRKRQGMSDEIVGLSSYYVLGENIYMAPSVGNILGSRMLSAVTSLTKLLSAASALPDFTPALGHTYFPPTTKSITTPGSSFQITQASKEGTPMAGANTPRPDTNDAASARTSLAPKNAADTDYQGLRMLAESWELSLRYGNEYMDENPIVGEPGSFKLSKSRDLALSSSMSTISSINQPFKVSTSPKKTPAPLINTDIPPEPSKKSGLGTAKSPMTPGGSKEKKARRKSKAAGAGDTTTPKASTPKPGLPE